MSRFFLLIISAIFFFSSCQLDERTKFILSYQANYEQTDSLPHTGNNVQELSIPFVYDYEGDVAFYGSSENKIESAECYEIIFRLTDSSDVRNLDFMEKVEFILRAEGENDVSLRQINVNRDINAIQLNFSVIEGVKDILEKGRFDLVLRFQSRESLQKDMQVESFVKFLVDSRRFFI